MPKHTVAQKYILAADQKVIKSQTLLPYTKGCMLLCDPSSCCGSRNPQHSPDEAPELLGQLDLIMAEQEDAMA